MYLIPYFDVVVPPPVVHRVGRQTRHAPQWILALHGSLSHLQVWFWRLWWWRRRFIVRVCVMTGDIMTFLNGLQYRHDIMITLNTSTDSIMILSWWYAWCVTDPTRLFKHACALRFGDSASYLQVLLYYEYYTLSSWRNITPRCRIQQPSQDVPFLYEISVYCDCSDCMVWFKSLWVCPMTVSLDYIIWHDMWQSNDMACEPPLWCCVFLPFISLSK